MADSQTPGDLPIATIRDTFRDWTIWRAESCFTAELRPTPTARHIVVAPTLAGLSAKLGTEPPGQDDAR
jgi:hypothetical protein